MIESLSFNLRECWDFEWGLSWLPSEQLDCLYMASLEREGDRWCVSFPMGWDPPTAKAAAFLE